MTRAATARKIDIKRAIDAVKAGGVKIARVEIDGTKIVIVSDSGRLDPQSDLDKWISAHEN